MKVINSFKIKSLEVFRYSITETHNGSFRPFYPAASSSHTVTMAITYAQLQHAHEDRILRESNSVNAQQILRNHISALRGFMRWLDKSETSPVGVELSNDYADVVRRHLVGMNAGERSKSDRRSLLNAVRVTFEALGEAPEVLVRGRERSRASALPANRTPFEQGLRMALKRAGYTPKSAALAAGVSPSALGRWARGALPNTRSSETLGKLDRLLGLPAGHLAKLLEETVARQAPTNTNSFRQQLSKRVADTYFLKPRALLPPFLVQWQHLLRHKTDDTPNGKARGANGRWNKTGPATSPSAIAGITTMNGAHFASAGVLWTHVSSFLGFLARPVAKGGFGVEDGVAQSLAWLAVPDALERYLQFQETRSDGLRHTGQEVFCTSLISLLHRETGYLPQSPELESDLPAFAKQGRTWQEMCSQSHRALSNWKRTCTDLSRDPAEPIQFLLDQSTPLAPVFQAMEKLHNIACGAPGGNRDEAVARRDELLLGLIVSNPLRKKNLIELTYREDNSGNIYRDTQGRWRIRLQRSAFKNQKLKKKKRNAPYDVAVAQWLHPLLNDYVSQFRPVLAGDSEGNTLFLTRNGLPMNDLTHRVLELTREHIPGSGGFGPHAFRHLVATDWLRRNPRDYRRVAELLNDTIEVVLNTYSHLEADETLNQHSEQLELYLPSHLRG